MLKLTTEWRKATFIQVWDKSLYTPFVMIMLSRKKNNQNKINTLRDPGERSLKCHSYLVVVGVETLDDVDADDDVDTELEVEALIKKYNVHR